MNQLNFSELNLSNLSDSQLFELVQAWVAVDSDGASRLQDAIGSALWDAYILAPSETVENNSL